MALYFLDNDGLRPFMVRSPMYHPRNVCGYRQLHPCNRSRQEALEKLFADQDTFDKDKLLSDLRELTNLVFNQSSEVDDGKREQEAAAATGQIRTDPLSLVNDGRDFQVQINAKHFNPEKIQVRIRHGYLTVEAREEEADENEGTYHFRQLRRRFRLPEGVDPDTVTCEMFSEGVMTIKAPAQDAPKQKERVVQIDMSNAKPVEDKKEA